MNEQIKRLERRVEDLKPKPVSEPRGLEAELAENKCGFPESLLGDLLAWAREHPDRNLGSIPEDLRHRATEFFEALRLRNRVEFKRGNRHE